MPERSPQPLNAAFPDAAAGRALQQGMVALAEHVSLPFRARTWKGQAGSWQGLGVGSSIDFQDHRPYLPGDDPRYIDWRAYARTGHHIMKLYREEVSPVLDLVLDVSASMFFEPAKANRAVELFAFATESARAGGASLRSYVICGAQIRPLPLEQFLADGPPFSEAAAPELTRVPWRQGSLRLLISDLLFPGAPDSVLSLLSAGRGRGLVLAPYSRAESSPDWRGNVEFIDCETAQRRLQQVSEPTREAYLAAYARHFGLWRERARRHAVLLAQVPAEPPMREALQGEAARIGAVEIL